MKEKDGKHFLRVGARYKSAIDKWAEGQEDRQSFSNIYLFI